MSERNQGAELSRLTSRRMATRLLAESALGAVAWSTVTMSPGILTSIWVTKRAANTANHLETHPDTSLVKDFAAEILKAGKRISDFKPEDQIVKIVAGMFAADATLAYWQGGQSALQNRVGGTAVAIAAGTIDFISSKIVAKQAKDPRFKEYGLDKFTGESNPVPGGQNKAMILRAAVYDIGAFLFPMVGRTYLGASPFIFETNYKTAHTIKVSLEFGDQVKEMIANNQDTQSILNFLQSQGQQDSKNKQPEVQKHQPLIF